MKFILIITLIFGLNIACIAQDKINQVDANNLKQGYWIRTDETNNKQEEGGYINNKKEGIWKKYYPSGKVKSEITYKSSRPNGYAKFYYENGNISEEGIWKGNKWTGDYKFYHQNGNVAYEWQYNEKGKRTGVQKYYHENGNIMIEGEWTEGKEAGTVKEFYADGSLKSVKRFENGNLDVSTVKNYDKGETKTVKEPEIIKSPTILTTASTPDTPKEALGVFTGEGYHKLYNRNKQVDREGEFHEGKLINGKRFYYNAESELEKTVIYKNGKIVDLIYAE